jgi:hypothetical protein
MSGNMVRTVAPDPFKPELLDGFANLDTAERFASAVLGGHNDGTIQVVVEGFAATGIFGQTAEVIVEHTPWKGRYQVVNGTDTLASGIRPIENDQVTITIPNANDVDGYRVLLKPTEDAPTGTGGSTGAGGSPAGGGGGSSASGGSGGGPLASGGSGRGPLASGGDNGTGGLVAAGGTYSTGGAVSSDGATDHDDSSEEGGCSVGPREGHRARAHWLTVLAFAGSLGFLASRETSRPSRLASSLTCAERVNAQATLF